MIVNIKPYTAQCCNRDTTYRSPANTRCDVYLPAVFIHEAGFLERKTRTIPPGSGLPDKSWRNEIKHRFEFLPPRFWMLGELSTGFRKCDACALYRPALWSTHDDIALQELVVAGTLRRPLTICAQMGKMSRWYACRAAFCFVCPLAAGGIDRTGTGQWLPNP